MKELDNTTYSNKINRIMHELGCEGNDGEYTHEDLNISFDLTKTDDKDILLDIAHKLLDMGYESCKEEFKNFLGV